jgi:hypothetical protein
VPANGTVGVPVNTALVITFSEPMNTTAVEAGLAISPVIALGKVWSVGNTTLTLKIVSNFSANTTYRVTVGTKAKDVAGNPLTGAYVTEFKTWVDTDGDGISDAIDPDIDGDGVPNGEDAFPLDSTEWLDTDGDGIGNNADPDDDGDGVPDEDDPEPLDPNVTGRTPYLTYAIAIMVVVVCLAIFSYVMLRKKKNVQPPVT